MSLVKATVQNTIKSKMDDTYGPADDPDEQAKFTGALAEAIIEILTTQLVSTVSGVTLVGTPGGPLTIAAQPVTHT